MEGDRGLAAERGPAAIGRIDSFENADTMADKQSQPKTIFEARAVRADERAEIKNRQGGTVPGKTADTIINGRNMLGSLPASEPAARQPMTRLICAAQRPSLSAISTAVQLTDLKPGSGTDDVAA